MSENDDLDALRLELHRNGYHPVPILGAHVDDKGAGKRPVMRGWSTLCATADEEEIVRWSRRFRQATNSGILSGEIVGIDVDILDDAIAHEIEALAQEMLGPTPLKRIGKAPKCLLVYRTEKPFHKIQTPEFHFVDGNVARVEALATGQQFVAFGIHPGTMAEYWWPNKSPLNIPAPELPLICEDVVRQFIGAVETALKRSGGLCRDTIEEHERTGRKAAGLHPGEGVSVELVEEALQYVPNKDLPYDDWVRIGLAVCAGLGEAGRRLWEGWSAVSSKNESSVTSAKYGSFFSVRSISIGTLFYRAKQNGWPGRKWKRRSVPSANPDDDDRPVIKIRGGHHPEEIDQAEDALLSAGVDLFQRVGMIVCPGHRSIEIRNGLKVTALAVTPVRPPRVRDLMTRVAHFIRYDKRSEEWVYINCPKDIAEAYLARNDGWRLRFLAGVINTPTLRPDVSVLDKPGYDSETGILFDPEGWEFGSVPAAPGFGDAKSALAVLNELLAEFPFCGNADRSVALSAILTALVRRSVPTAPMHVFTAPVAGSGKSLLVDISSMIATGHPAAVISQGGSAEEFEKRLGAAMLAGDMLISIDNCKDPLEGELICQVLTQTRLKIRVLGHSKLIELPTSAAVFATGNNLAIIGDLGRRTLLCKLDPAEEHPEERPFAFDPLDSIRADRSKYVLACLTILRAYHLAGRPCALKPFGSFKEWSNLIRGALVWLGCADPCESMEAIRCTDYKLEMHRTLLVEWERAIGLRRISARDLADEADGNEPLRDALLAILGEQDLSNVRRLGLCLSKLSDRVLGGRRIVKGGTLNGTGTWRLELVGQQAFRAA